MINNFKRINKNGLYFNFNFIFLSIIEMNNYFFSISFFRINNICAYMIFYKDKCSI